MYENDEPTPNFPETLRETLAYQKKAISMLKYIKTKKDDYKNVLPKNIRDKYDKRWEDVIDIENEINFETDEINNCIQTFEELKPILKEITDVIQEIKATINSANVGTLEARAREAIAKSKIDTNDDMYKTVFNQPYNELNKGGKNISKKNRKNRKNNKTKQRKETKVSL